MIDINKPLEIVHIDGRVEVATFKRINKEGDIYTKEMVKDGHSEYNGIWYSDGRSWDNCTPSWRLRNVQEEIPAHIKAYIDERFAALSEPVIDPDVIAVREILGVCFHAVGEDSISRGYNKGLFDNDPDFQAALAAYKKHKHG